MLNRDQARPWHRAHRRRLPYRLADSAGGSLHARCHSCASSLREIEFFASYELTEIGALGFRILARFVLRPSIEVGSTEALDVALFLILLTRSTSPVVAIDPALNVSLVEAIRMYRDIERQACSDPAFRSGITHAKAGQRKYP